MRCILSFKNLEDENLEQCICGEHLRDGLSGYHEEMVGKLKPSIPEAAAEGEEGEEAAGIGAAAGTMATVSTKPSNGLSKSKKWSQKLFSLVKMVKAATEESVPPQEPYVPTPEGVLHFICALFTIIWVAFQKRKQRLVLRLGKENLVSRRGVILNVFNT